MFVFCFSLTFSDVAYVACVSIACTEDSRYWVEKNLILRWLSQKEFRCKNRFYGKEARKHPNRVRFCLPFGYLLIFSTSLMLLLFVSHALKLLETGFKFRFDIFGLKIVLHTRFKIRFYIMDLPIDSTYRV